MGLQPYSYVTQLRVPMEKVREPASSVSTVTSLSAGRPRKRGSISGGEGVLSLLQSVLMALGRIQHLFHGRRGLFAEGEKLLDPHLRTYTHLHCVYTGFISFYFILRSQEPG